MENHVFRHVVELGFSNLFFQVSIAVPKAKLEAERGFHRGGPGGPHPAAAAAAQGSIADNLPPSALASLVSKV